MLLLFVETTCKAREVFSNHHPTFLPVLGIWGIKDSQKEGGAEWEGKKLPDNTSMGAKSVGVWISIGRWWKRGKEGGLFCG